VADYYTPAQLALKFGISEAQIAELESEGFLHPKPKDGRRFFSSRQAHDLQVALRLARKQKISLEQAFTRVEDMRVRQASAIGS
jgi:DNA-binding transcriptional MerR regulator